VLLYAANLIYCQHSVLQLLDAGASDSDMHANLMWAKGIREQGWLNPRPYHPWTNWMQLIAPYPQWVEWWGGEQTFQQSLRLSVKSLPAQIFFDAHPASVDKHRNLYFHRTFHRTNRWPHSGLDRFLAGGSLCAVLPLFVALFARWAWLVPNSGALVGTFRAGSAGVVCPPRLWLGWLARCLAWAFWRKKPICC